MFYIGAKKVKKTIRNEASGSRGKKVVRQPVEVVNEMPAEAQLPKYIVPDKEPVKIEGQPEQSQFVPNGDGVIYPFKKK